MLQLKIVTCAEYSHSSSVSMTSMNFSVSNSPSVLHAGSRPISAASLIARRPLHALTSHRFNSGPSKESEALVNLALDQVLQATLLAETIADLTCLAFTQRTNAQHQQLLLGSLRLRVLARFLGVATGVPY
ncbi:hypothetical protein C8F04DRAFT_1183841 [Mycena alexandri]|uniref:Uncharacterized protein n=1 Tax=Mycena alexandri TaxID=1745969 RepID=A0AAD6SXL6_9AGAR|nr:hypothetical protein C8F04DRAFT_1183841 [Mycena alexandri]